MKKLTRKEQRSVHGGHYHWYCSVNGFTSTSYSRIDNAAIYLQRHVDRYPDHDQKVSIFSCAKSH